MERIAVYYTDKYSGSGSHDLLLIAASLYSGIAKEQLCLESIRGKKPFFISHPHIHFSISHSGSIWMCAFADNEVGADIQLISGERQWVKLAERFFNSREADDVSTSGDKRAVFSRIWSRKEAVVKLFGIGIDGKFATFDSRSDIVNFSGKDVFVKDINLPISDDYSASIAYLKNFEVELHKLT